MIKADDVNNLSTGMKKMSIKLKVKDPENATADSQAKSDGKVKKAKVTRKPAVPKPAKLSESESSRHKINGPIVDNAKTPSAPSIELAAAQTTHGLQNEMNGALPNSPKTTSPTNGDTEPSGGFQDSNSSNALSETHGSEAVRPVLAIANVIDIAEAVPDTNLTTSSNKDRSAPEGPTEQAAAPVIPETPIKAISSALPASLPAADTVTNFIAPNNIASKENTATASASAPPTVMGKKTKADLPVFTSTSPIPFAKSKQGHTEDGQQRQLQDLGPSAFNNAKLDERNELQTEPEKGKTTEASSIWDIPETPQR